MIGTWAADRVAGLPKDTTPEDLPPGAHSKRSLTVPTYLKPVNLGLWQHTKLFLRPHYCNSSPADVRMRLFDLQGRGATHWTSDCTTSQTSARLCGTCCGQVTFPPTLSLSGELSTAF